MYVFSQIFWSYFFNLHCIGIKYKLHLCSLATHLSHCYCTWTLMNTKFIIEYKSSSSSFMHKNQSSHFRMYIGYALTSSTCTALRKKEFIWYLKPLVFTNYNSPASLSFHLNWICWKILTLKFHREMLPKDIHCCLFPSQKTLRAMLIAARSIMQCWPWFAL